MDIFRVAGGKDHTKFFLSHFGTITPAPDLSFELATDYSHPQMRNFKVARKAKPGWSVTWNIVDRYTLLPTGSDIRLRYTDFTTDADAYTCEAWVVAGSYNSTTEAWLPRLMTRRKSDASTFVSIIEPYEKKTGPLIKSMRRLPLQSDSSVALQIELADGSTDLIISKDSTETISATNLSTDATLCHLRRSTSGDVMQISITNGNFFTSGPVKATLTGKGFVQVRFEADAAILMSGSPELLRSIERDGKPFPVRK